MTSAAEAAEDSQLGGRLPLLTPAELDPEQAQLRNHLAATRGADARAAVLGEAGVGKTALLDVAT